MKLSMHEHFVLLAIAILFEFNKVASSRRGWQSNGKCGGHTRLDATNWRGKFQIWDYDWRVFGSQGERVNCARVIFNKGNVRCGGHSARTCSQCPCDATGRGTWNYHLCSGDCQWSGDPWCMPTSYTPTPRVCCGVCHMRQKINKGK